AGLGGDRPAAQRLGSSAAGGWDESVGSVGHGGVRFANVVDVPVHDGRSVGRVRRFLGGIEAEGHDFVLVFLSLGAGNHGGIEMAVEKGLGNGFRGGAGQVAEQSGDAQEDGKHSFHKVAILRSKVWTTRLVLRGRNRISILTIFWKLVWSLRIESLGASRTAGKVPSFQPETC